MSLFLGSKKQLRIGVIKLVLVDPQRMIDLGSKVDVGTEGK